MRLKNFEKLEEILKISNEIDYVQDKKARSTLNGCKSLAWAKYQALEERGTGKAVDFAKLAIKDDPEFAGWVLYTG